MNAMVERIHRLYLALGDFGTKKRTSNRCPIYVREVDRNSGLIISNSQIRSLSILFTLQI